MNVFRSDQFPLILMVILTLAGLIVFWSIMDMVLLGASLAIVLLPLHHWITKRTGFMVSGTMITLLVLLSFSALGYFTLVFFSSNSSTLTTLFSTIGNWVNNPATNPMAYGIPLGKTSITALLNEGNSLFVDYQKTILAYLPVIVFKAFTFFATLFVLIIHGEEIKRRIMTRLHPDVKEYVNRLSDVTVDVLYAIYIVQVAIAVLTFFIALPVFYLLGYGDILFYSFFAAFCELIPVLGSSVVFVLIGAYSLALGDKTGLLITFFLGYVGVSLLPEVYIRPVLVGRRVKIHPVIMFIGIIGGLLTMGLAGFVLGPVIIVLLITTYRMYVRDRKDRTPSFSGSGD
jgi:predicted PurR-regulated permease PerM